MTKEELKEMLKDSLKVQVEKYFERTSHISGVEGFTVKILFDGEEISSSNFILKFKGI